jgi:dGTPase
MSAARRVVTELYSAFTGDPRLLPSEWRADCGAPHDPQTGRIVRDYIAGMTDRFALLEHRRIFGGEIVL